MKRRMRAWQENAREAEGEKGRKGIDRIKIEYRRREA
jgi:hypothetical protein